jgi:DNA transposition AAA+ family ATPase
VDEADRLSFNSLEEHRTLYDEYKFGLILTGKLGIEKRLSLYAQFYSRIGFVHEFKALGKNEMKFLFE